MNQASRAAASMTSCQGTGWGLGFRGLIGVAIGYILGLYRDTGKENGNYYRI